MKTGYFKAMWLGVGLLFMVDGVAAQTVFEELKETVRAEVVEVVSETEREIIGTDTVATVQLVRAKILSGTTEGEVVEFENELVSLAMGDRIFLDHIETINGDTWYQFKEVDRRGTLLLAAGLFALLLLWFGRLQGARALLSLGLSGVAILFALVPALLAGYDPALTSFAVAAVVLALVLFGTHGFKAHTTVAYLGTMGAVLATCVIAYVFVAGARLTGFGSDAAIYLNFATNGQLDFAGLLLGGIIIGILGVLDDVSITQASVVVELRRANVDLGARELYERAIRVGRDHVGSLVNTLALAYVGVSIPLVLLYASSGAPMMLAINQEVVAAELLRILVGSIGLVLAVPLTTAAAAWWFARQSVTELEKTDHEFHVHH